MPKKDVVVRMFRQGLGDCFLLSFPTAKKQFHMLIDCGALPSAHYDSTLMKEVVSEIKTITGGHLNILAVTHEHWDHVSGFIQAQEIFDSIKVDTVWVPWTEDPADQVAQKLKQDFGKGLTALHDVLQHVAESPHQQCLTRMLEMYGGLGAGKQKTKAAWDYVLSKGKTVFCRPDLPPMKMEGVDNVRVYVLGPPLDTSFLRKCLSPKETYDRKDGSPSFLGFLNCLSSTGADAGPCDSRFSVTIEAAKELPFFQRHYGFHDQDPHSWRRIDNDWDAAAGELALNLDNYTNNTSLVLAFELVDSGKVLLFPGDAQVGNWLSWANLSWSVKQGGRDQNVTADDLLRRTTLYKVGHHGSHNATLRAKGLEKMVDGGLAAMIPVHRKTAEDKDWNFPFPQLYSRLKSKTRGRVVLSDEDSFPFDDVSEGKEQFQNDLSVNELYVEYRIPC